MSERWVTVSEAAQLLGTSEKTVWKRVKDGKYESRLEGRRRMVRLTDDDLLTAPSESEQEAVTRMLRERVTELEKALAAERERTDALLAELRETRQRSDTIIQTLAMRQGGLLTRAWAKLTSGKDTDSHVHT